MPQEFLAATLSQHQMEKAENMRAAFLHFDKDGSGTISRDELREALKVCIGHRWPYCCNMSARRADVHDAGSYDSLF